MKIELSKFGGMAPKIDQRVLADNLSADAFNVSFESGIVGESNITTIISPDFPQLSNLTKSILRPGNTTTRLYFTTATTNQSFASMLAPNDKWGRVYFTREDGPRFTVSDNYNAGGLTMNPLSYKLGVPTPAIQPTVGTPAFTYPEGTSEDLTKVAYCFTYVDTYGHEGAPSAPSVIVSLPTDIAFTCKLTFTPENLPEFPMTDAVRRIYRTTFDGSTSAWQFISDVPISNSTWTDTIALGEEAEELISTDWVPPPTLKEMIPVASAYVAGFHDNFVCYSEAQLPHAWPESYRHPLKYSVVGLCATQNGLLIATNGKPYWASGADPASAVPVELDANHPCLSRNSIVDMGGYVIYASYDGLVAVSGTDVQLITAPYMDRRTWLSQFSPEKIVAFAHEGRYVFSVGKVWWMYDPAEQSGYTMLNIPNVTPATLVQAYYDAQRDTTVLLRNDGNAFDVIPGSGGAFHWRSKIYQTPPVNFGAIQVLATKYPVTVDVWADGVRTGYAVLSNRPQRLVSGVRATEWQFQLNGVGGRISLCLIGTSPREFG